MFKKIKPLHLLSFLLAVFLTISGCQQKENDNREASQQPNYDLTLVNNKKGTDQSDSNQAKKWALENKAVKGARAVNVKNSLLLAVDVKQLNRFQLKKIEKDIKKKLTDEFPDKTVDISTDKKLFLELDQLEQEIQNDKLDTKQIDKRYKKIKEMINDQA